MSVNRAPAIQKAHPASELPERPAPAVPAPAAPTPAGQTVPAPPATIKTSPDSSGGGEKLSETHNTRIRPTTKTRLRRAVDKMRYDSGDRSISEASITDIAIDEFLQKHNL